MSRADVFDEVERRIEALSGEEIDAFVGEFMDPEAGMELLREQIAQELRTQAAESHPDHIFYIGG